MIAVPVGLVFLALLGLAAWGWSLHKVQIGALEGRLDKLEAMVQPKRKGPAA